MIGECRRGKCQPDIPRCFQHGEVVDGQPNVDASSRIERFSKKKGQASKKNHIN